MSEDELRMAFERAEAKQQRFYPGDDEMLAILYQEELEGLLFSNYLMMKGRSKFGHLSFFVMLVNNI